MRGGEAGGAFDLAVELRCADAEVTGHAFNQVVVVFGLPVNHVGHLFEEMERLLVADIFAIVRLLCGGSDLGIALPDLPAGEEQLGDNRHQLIFVNRLGYQRVGSTAESLQPLLACVAQREEHHRDVGREGCALNQFAEVATVHEMEFCIGKDQFRQTVGSHLYRFITVGGSDQFVPVVQNA